MRRRGLLGMAAGAAVASGAGSAFRVRMERAMAAARVPGMAVGRVERGALAGVDTYGDCTEDTVFQAASLTKQVTGYMVLALRDAGKLSLERTLVSYVDEIGDERGRRATLSHALSHSTGFPNWRSEGDLAAAFEPGQEWRYSGEGYVYLQRIIEKVTGRGIGAAAEEMVFRPLGMEASAMRWRGKWEGRYAEPHGRDGRPRREWDKAGRAVERLAERLGREPKYEDSILLLREAGMAAVPNNVLPNGAASLMTTAKDYGRFVAAAMKNPELRRARVTMGEGKGWQLGWGLGWGIERVDGREYLWQWGDNPGYKNIVFAEPGKGKAVVVFTNGDGGGRVYERVVRQETGQEHPALFRI